MINMSLSQLPLGQVTPLGYLKTQLSLQRENITEYMEQYEEFGNNSGWLGGSGEAWERGPYYVRGLIALAYTLHDKGLIHRAKKWIDYSVDNQKENGDFGSKLILSSDIENKENDVIADEWWARMPMLMAISDYYDAEKSLGNDDKRILPFFEKYFKFQLKYIKKHPLGGWAEYRGADNVASIIWFANKCLDNGESRQQIKWLYDLANIIIDQSFDWSNSFVNTYTREHIVNTTQGFKYPYYKYLLSGDISQLNALKIGLERIGNDHGRIDYLPNADEAAKDNKPINGAETCAVVEGMLSFELAGAITSESYLYDLLESYLYNNLPNCFDYNITGYNYYQVENSVIMSHGQHGYINDHGDSNAIGIGGFECCFSNLHMGYPKFLQNMWAIGRDNSLVLTAYGANKLDTKLADKNIVFTQQTNYPYRDFSTLVYSGDSTQIKLKLRIPIWTKSFDVLLNNCKLKYKSENNFAVMDIALKFGDQIDIIFKSETEIIDFHTNSMYVKKGLVLYCNPIKEDWRVTKDYSYRGVKYNPIGTSCNWEIYPNEYWNYTFEKSTEMLYSDNNSYDSNKNNSPDNYPSSISLDMKKASNWTLDGNNASTIVGAVCSDTVYKRKLIPTAFSRLKISVFPKISMPIAIFDDDNSYVLSLVNSNLSKVPEVDTDIYTAFGMAQLSFSVQKDKSIKYYIVYGEKSNKYTNVSSCIKANEYIFGGDPYGARIEQDKSSVYLDNEKTYYLRIAYIKNSNLIKVSKEVRFN